LATCASNVAASPLRACHCDSIDFWKIQVPTAALPPKASSTTIDSNSPIWRIIDTARPL
jgi:hypothetical protein